MENVYWFEAPTQVRVYDCIENGEAQFFNAIAFEDKIICACCGMLLSIDAIYSNADEDHYTGEVIKPFKDWVDFSDYIGE